MSTTTIAELPATARTHNQMQLDAAVNDLTRTLNKLAFLSAGEPTIHAMVQRGFIDRSATPTEAARAMAETILDRVAELEAEVRKLREAGA